MFSNSPLLRFSTLWFNISVIELGLGSSTKEEHADPNKDKLRMLRSLISLSSNMGLNCFIIESDRVSKFKIKYHGLPKDINYVQDYYRCSSRFRKSICRS